ncbi:MAG: glycosyltransferase family 2 protein [Bacteroidia bacterium]|nr:glycosyltransferase family 2 protein [Bacteroidia bacterium]
MKISIIVTCYNNSGSLPELWERLQKLSEKPIFQNHFFEFLFVDDGSEDSTYSVLQQFQSFHNHEVVLVKLTRNFGSYNSFLAGMSHAGGQANVYLHADLQDPPELIEEMFTYFLKDIPLVIAHRESREDGSIFSSLYHWMVRKFAIQKTPPGGFDLLLFHEKIRNDVVAISEKSTNNVYLINWLGYPFVQIPYKRLKRRHGKSQWSLRKKAHLFIDTVFSFTNLPLDFIRFLGFLSIINLGLAGYFLVFQGSSISHQLWFWTSTILFMLGMLGIILGEYLFRVHETVRNRPNFVVESRIKQ